MKKMIQLLMIIGVMFINAKVNAQTCTVNAGPDQSICCGGTCVYLDAGTSSDCGCTNTTYQWLPTTGLTNPTGVVTQACPSVTTVYTVCATFYKMQHGNCVIVCCQACDVVTVTILTGTTSCCRLMAPNSITAIGKNALDIKLYPNPASTDITIDVSVPLKNAEISIYDVTGRPIWQKKNVNEAGKIPVDVSSFPKGIYFIKATETGVEVYNNKIVLE